MSLSTFQRSAVRLFRGLATRLSSEQLETHTRRARMGVRAEVVTASAIFASIITFLALAVLLGFFGFVVLPQAGIDLGPILAVALVTTPGLVAMIVFVVFLTAPQGVASQRAAKIDNNLPFALNYLSSMSSAGVTIHTSMMSLAGQPIYGELASEAKAISKDIALGIDTVTALHRATERSPSKAWAEVLQGAVATTVSGGDLSAYFKQKAERYAFENKETMKQLVEVMGLMSETYVTVAVAGPLFMIIMSTIMSMLGTGEPGILIPLVYAGLPLINVGFAWVLQLSMPEV